MLMMAIMMMARMLGMMEVIIMAMMMIRPLW